MTNPHVVIQQYVTVLYAVINNSIWYTESVNAEEYLGIGGIEFSRMDEPNIVFRIVKMKYSRTFTHRVFNGGLRLLIFLEPHLGELAL